MERLDRRWQAPFAVEVGSVLSVHRRGTGDPSYAVDDTGAIWRACHTPDGPGTVRISWRHGRDETGQTLALAQAWGPGASWLLEVLPAMLGAQDRPEDFAPADPVMRELARRHAAVRIGRSCLVLESLVPAVLEQKVVGKEAWRSWRLLLRRFGEPAPGPGPEAIGRPGGRAPARMRVPPGPQTWASIPSWEWHRAGVEAVRARTIAAAARAAGRLEEILHLPPEQADRRLQAIAGVGAWTSAEVRQRACGDPDAVSVGDYHLPSVVGMALAGRPVDDAGMLELLAPYAGHRHRASLLTWSSGARPARRGPRLAIRDYRAF